MGKAYKCDKCGVLFESPSVTESYDIGEIKTTSNEKRNVCLMDVASGYKTFELCNKCKRSFLEWWKEELK